jgi:hypothetical protein
MPINCPHFDCRLQERPWGDWDQSGDQPLPARPPAGLKNTCGNGPAMRERVVLDDVVA